MQHVRLRRANWGGGASACAEGSKEEAGKDRMERQGVSGACFSSRGGRQVDGRMGGEQPRSWASLADPNPSACLLPSEPPLAWPGPDILTD